MSLGVLGGACIEALIPTHSASVSTAGLLFEAFVQVALNGVLLSQIGPVIQNDDPTFGMQFSLGLWEAQPGLRMRLDLLGALVTKQVAQFSQQMLPPAVEAESPSQGLKP